MEVRYRREINETYMILGEEEDCEEYPREILTRNHLEGLMPLTVYETDGMPEYYFSITRGSSLLTILAKRTIRLGEIRQILFALADVLEEMERYLLEVDHLVLTPECIYGLPDLSGMEFCCHPAYRKDFFTQVQELLRFFLEKLDHSDRESVEIAYELFEVSSRESFRFEDLLQIARRRTGPEEEEEEMPPEKGEEEPFWTPPEEEEEEKEPASPGNRLTFLLPLLGALLLAAAGGYRYLAGGIFDVRCGIGAVLLLLAALVVKAAPIFSKGH